MLLFEVANQNPPFGHKLGPVTYDADILKLCVYGITQLARLRLLHQHDGYLFQAGLVLPIAWCFPKLIQFDT